MSYGELIGYSYIPTKSKDSINQLEQLFCEGKIEAITSNDSMKEFALLEIIYKGKGQRKSFQGFLVWKATASKIYGARGYFYLEKVLYYSNSDLLEDLVEGVIVRRDIRHRNVYKLVSGVEVRDSLYNNYERR